MKVIAMHGDPKIENYKINRRSLKNHSNYCTSSDDLKCSLNFNKSTFFTLHIELNKALNN